MIKESTALVRMLALCAVVSLAQFGLAMTAQAETFLPDALASVTDNGSNGTPDTQTNGSFFVLARGAPFQEERGIVEFNLTNVLQAPLWTLRLTAAGGTGRGWHGRRVAHRGVGQHRGWRDRPVRFRCHQ